MRTAQCKQLLGRRNIICRRLGLQVVFIKTAESVIPFHTLNDWTSWNLILSLSRQIVSIIAPRGLRYNSVSLLKTPYNINLLFQECQNNAVNWVWMDNLVSFSLFSKHYLDFVWFIFYLASHVRKLKRERERWREIDNR